jgi:hypothetical protein
MRAVPAGENTNLVGLYVQDKTGCSFDPGMFTAMAILDTDGSFCGGVVFSEYRDYDCQLSCAAETPIAWKEEVLRAIFDYTFNQLGTVRCTALTKKSNRRARAFLEGLGFVLEGRIRRGYDGVKDALIYGLLREECVYIQELDGGTVQANEIADGAEWELHADVGDTYPANPNTAEATQGQENAPAPTINGVPTTDYYL